ncbi:MAG: DUF4328 domain-containing protein [Mycobacterium sp.]|nr:DUF4328 domain-containing protein [Mycobacterium sp.]
MIQVCSGCGTRWNVRDRQRMWCPRCRGALLPPVAAGPETDARWSGRATTQAVVGQHAPPRLPPGYRWIAVRPGAPPPARPRRRPLGPTPRYTAMPRWSLGDRVDAVAGTQTSSTAQEVPAAAPVRMTLAATIVALAIAALVHVVRYLLLIINRNTLLNPVVAAAALWLGVLASLAAIAAAVTCAIVLTRWLIGRRAAAFRHGGRAEPRPGWALWSGCLVPPWVAVVVALLLAIRLAMLKSPPGWTLMAFGLAVCLLPLVALVWALVYALELGKIEGQHDRMRKPIWTWWLLWLTSSVAAVFATATSSARDAQGIANNTAATTVAYLLALITVGAAARVFEGFERRPIERPIHRWLVVGDERPSSAASVDAVELDGEEPAA